MSIYGAEVGKVYGQPIETFSRFWILAGSHVLFIVDRIEATQPVTTLWNWVVNNREGQTKWTKNAHSLTIHKQNAGMKLFHGGQGAWTFLVHGFLHDAYHPEPNQLGEGKSGSSLLFRFTEKQRAKTRTVVHAIALDTPELLEKWQFEQENNTFTLRNGVQKWTLNVNDDATGTFSIVSNKAEKWDIHI